MKDIDAVIKELQITEKGTEQAELGKYLFRVDLRANKLEIKRAVEKRFKVAVANVNTMRFAGKKKRERTVNFGKRPDWKRAVVTLKPGHKIEVA